MATQQERNQLTQPNIYRDGKSIVVPRAGAIFPSRCIKTNRPVANADFSFRLKLIATHYVNRPILDHSVVVDGIVGMAKGAQLAGSAVGGVAGGAALLGHVAMVAMSPVIDLRFGLDARRQKSYTLHRWIARGTIVLGVVAIFAALMMLFIVASRPASPSQKSVDGILGILFAGGGAAFLIGVFYHMIVARPLLNHQSYDDQFAWLTGANADFRESLPEFPLFWNDDRWVEKQSLSNS